MHTVLRVGYVEFRPKTPDADENEQENKGIAEKLCHSCWGEDGKQHQDHGNDLKDEQPAWRVVGEKPRSGFYYKSTGVSDSDPVCAAHASSAPQLKAMPRNTWGHHVKRLAKG